MALPINDPQIALPVAAARVIEAQRAAEKAAEFLAAAKAEFVRQAEASGINSVEVGEHRVTTTRKERRNFKVAALAERVSAAIFDRVTRRAVDTKAYDAAVALGLVPADLEDQVADKTEYDEVRVTRLD